MIYEMLSGIHPFKVRNKNQLERLRMIVEEDIVMQPTFTIEACSLLTGLLEKHPKSRYHRVG